MSHSLGSGVQLRCQSGSAYKRSEFNFQFFPGLQTQGVCRAILVICAESSTSPARCFPEVMSGNSFPHTTPWSRRGNPGVFDSHPAVLPVVSHLQPLFDACRKFRTISDGTTTEDHSTLACRADFFIWRIGGSVRPSEERRSSS